MLTPEPSHEEEIVDLLKSLLWTIDKTVDPQTINNLTVDAVQEKVLDAISKNRISSNLISEFTNLLYGSNSPLVKEQANKVLNKTNDQNVKENFKQAKIRFIITKALCNKLIKEAQIRATQAAVQRKIDKARWRKGAGSILRAGQYWEELAEFDRMSEDKLLELIKKQHQEAMKELGRFKETIVFLKRQLKEIDKYESQVLDFYSKEIAVDLKDIKFKDGTSLFTNVSNKKMEEISKELIERKHKGGKKIEQLQQELNEMRQEKASIEKQIKEEIPSLEITAASIEKRGNGNNMEGLTAAPLILPLKKHREHTEKSQRASPLFAKLKALDESIKNQEAVIISELNEQDNYLLNIAKEHGLDEDAKHIAAHKEELKILYAPIEMKEKAARDELNFCSESRSEIKAQIKELTKAGIEAIEAQKEKLKILKNEAIEIIGDAASALEIFKEQEQNLEALRLTADEELKAKTEKKQGQRCRPDS